MNPSSILRTALFILLMATMAAGKDKTPPTYQKGTITGWSTKNYNPNITNWAGKHKFYELKGAGLLYQINDCGDFQTGLAVDYRVSDNKLYIRRDDGKEYKCKIDGTRTEEPAKTDAPSTSR
jgi:hypothetical protein